MNDRSFELYLTFALIHDTNFQNWVVPILPPDFFNEIDCRFIYETMAVIRQRNRPITFLSMREAVRRSATLSADNIEAICKSLDKYVDPSKKDAKFLDGLVNSLTPSVEEHVKQQLIERGLTKGLELYEATQYDDVLKLWSNIQRNSVYHIHEEQGILEIMDSADNLADALEFFVGIRTGIKGLDPGGNSRSFDDTYCHYDGLRPGDLFLIMGDSNLGKTSFCLNTGLYQSFLGYRVHYDSLEMPRGYMATRGISIATEIPSYDVVRGRAKEASKLMHQFYKERYPNSKEIVFSEYEASELSLSMIESKLMRAQQEGDPIDVLIIDSLDLMICERRFDKDYEEQIYNAGRLREIGKRYKCLIISPVQTGRGDSQMGKTKRKKTRRDIQGGFKIHAKCDVFFILSWLEEKNKLIDQTERVDGYLDVHIDKHRFGWNNTSLTIYPERSIGRMFDPFPTEQEVQKFLSTR
jgi:replicative DNA helicase